MSKEYYDQLNKFTAAPVSNDDAGHERIIQNFVLLAPEDRVAAIDDYNRYLKPDPSPREFGQHFALGRKLKSAHQNLKRVNR